MIEKYEIKESGYHPLLISDGWQIAQLNYDINQKVENIMRLDIHNHTDEVFLLLKGRAVLITAKIDDNQPHFELEEMNHGVIYNVPRKTWHNIVMDKKCEVIIVEKSNTHQNDFEFFQLTEKNRQELRKRVDELMEITKI
jgi:mannose-6-phosphate isomerase-like protein (cupin superfamily)